MSLIISEETYLMGRDKAAPLSPEQRQNMILLLAKVDILLKSLMPELLPLFKGISSGYRPAQINAAVKGAAKKSAHMSCEAVDLKDPTGDIGRKLRAREDVLEKAGLYLEHPSYTKGWVHLQTRPTKRRVFIPY